MNVTYLRLNLPEFSLFSTVHLTVDDQNVWQTSNVACLHLQWHKKTLHAHWGGIRLKVFGVLMRAVDMSEWELELTVG